MNNNLNLAFYHPNKSNSGFACSFSYSRKDNNIYATLIKQSNWDDIKKIGTFAGSRNDDTKQVNIKLNQVEVGGILDCLDKTRPLSTVHDSEKQTKSILFSPWLNKTANENEKPTQKGFSFSINVNDKEDTTKKLAFYIGLNFPEGRLLREYLIFALHKSFAAEIEIYPKPSENDI